ncbi:MAG: nucleotidyltransferase domain-containing protein [Defluviitaleaceae bacterium]|nr:nucleotidyltransferase domain-containing protein [Defluviitaleaceae bacterium]MCL2238370.1 nucleotidyltransferase domain-containing protein [Defluviitaleaceae bacterium]
MQGFITVHQAAEKWHVTPRQIQLWCKTKKILGVQKWGRDWAIPMDAVRPPIKHKNNITTAMQEITEEAKILFGDSLVKIVMFGSYARNDFTEGESDLDVALFLECKPLEVIAKRNELIDATINLDYKHNIMASYRIVSANQFEDCKDGVGLYSNILTEGVSYYERPQKTFS